MVTSRVECVGLRTENAGGEHSISPEQDSPDRCERSTASRRLSAGGQ